MTQWGWLLSKRDQRVQIFLEIKDLDGAAGHLKLLPNDMLYFYSVYTL